MAIPWLAFVLAILVTRIVGQSSSVSPANWTSDDATRQIEGSVGMQIAVGDEVISLAPVLALTDGASNNLPPTGLDGPALLVDASDFTSTHPDEFAFVACDEYLDELQVISLYAHAWRSNLPGVVFYSRYSDYCDLEHDTGNFQRVYTMESREETDEMLKKFNMSDQVYARLGSNVSARDSTGANFGENDEHDNINNNEEEDNNNGIGGLPGPTPSTAVAMIILYSITGVITALFLVIIVTGALRAHRHPERYGPRNFVGRARQTRARGLARAMLDSLPIVKAGDREAPKPTDIELGDSTRNANGTTESDTATTGDPNRNIQTTQTSQPADTRQSTEGGIAAAALDPTAFNPDSQGCSICTEDFVTGEDQRVLPCDHRFHPACVDPWLLNISGTCPLCRIDLRPAQTETGEVDEYGNPILREGEFDPDLAPPLGPNETPGDQRRMSVRRSIVIGIMGIGRPDRMTREERMSALRQLREQRLARQRREQQASVAETAEEEQSTRQRMRRVFGIRTRPTDQAGGGSTEPGPTR
ncbi:hypothetical protein LTR37_001229 [Vermiconidia calcicola]|uniref:Uncharacterized protein n=1 Tax=Vermiconidia calcicola TaxID=1690605 RepID=A0ACC3NVV1_9PEZI|nr:hypothetical protein LTR37_001229 [Vermiconidia calcicola]